MNRFLVLLAFLALSSFAPLAMSQDEFMVYSMYRPVDLGDSSEPPAKDYFLNLGTRNGLKNGHLVKVFRRAATYDLTSQKLFKDVQFPIARLRVIHAESHAAIARLESFLPLDKTPGISPRAIMVGDVVRQGE